MSRTGGRRKFGVSNITTANWTFEEDVKGYREMNVYGVEVWESKLVDCGYERALDILKENPIPVTNFVPTCLSILPHPQVEGIYQGPGDVDARVEDYIRSVKMARRFNLEGACLVLTGKGAYTEEKAKGLVIRSLKRVAVAAQEHGIKVALEPLHRDWYQGWTVVSTIPEALEVVEMVDEPNLGVFLDTWHIWVDKELERNVEKAGDRVFAVQINDWRELTRSWDDRTIPGRGIIPLGRILKAIEKTGYEGSYNLEIIQSGAYPDSIHKMDYREVISESRRFFEKAWKD